MCNRFHFDCRGLPLAVLPSTAAPRELNAGVRGIGQ